MEIKLNSIGHFLSPGRDKIAAPRQSSIDQSEEPGIIQLNEGSNFQQALEDLQGFSRIWVIYLFHLNTQWKPKVLPPRGTDKMKGVFATRSPYRPNPMGLSCLRLQKIEGLKLYVLDHDLVDQTPILDIKPYLPYADAFPESQIGWLDDSAETFFHLKFSDLAKAQLEFIETYLPLRMAIQTQLSRNPTDKKRKRIKAIDANWEFAYKTWRVLFQIEGETLHIAKIYSGYSLDDLKNPEDPYQDKAFHAEFNKTLPDDEFY